MLTISNNVGLSLGNTMRLNPNLDGSGAIKQSVLLENIKEVRLTSKNDFPAKRKASNIEKDFFNYAESEVEQDESFTTKCGAEAELNQYLASAKGCDDVLR